MLSNSVSITYGANSYCTKQANSDPNSWCFGTPSDDGIAANGLKHNILGLGGDDRIDAGSGATTITSPDSFEKSEKHSILKY
ncbi:MAG TPA: hypothetical protein VF884_00390 [Nitrososphaeraceae archaeon]